MPLILALLGRIMKHSCTVSGWLGRNFLGQRDTNRVHTISGGKERRSRPFTHDSLDHPYSRIKCFSCGEFGHMQIRFQRPDSSLLFKPAGWHLQSDNRPPRNGNNSPGKLLVDRDITPTGQYALHPAHLSSSYITSTLSTQSQEIDIITNHPQSNTCTETCASFTDQ